MYNLSMRESAFLCVFVYYVATTVFFIAIEVYSLNIKNKLHNCELNFQNN